jgi:hypothetical protein
LKYLVATAYLIVNATILSMVLAPTLLAQDQAEKGSPLPPKQVKISARASEIDPRAREHPELEFVFEKAGKPADLQNASVDLSVPSKGKLVLWLMAYPPGLFERVNSYGYHAIQVHYANGWFSKFGKEPPPADPMHLGNIRLEAVTGEDQLVEIPKPDGMKERAFQFVKWLDKKHPQGKWSQFLSPSGDQLAWDKVIISGSSHGASSSARFAIHQKVDRAVLFCGPRDQYETWQALPSATPTNRIFAFSHVLDSGWKGDHYCRSWLFLKLNQYGPLVDVDKTPFPFHQSRRLITAADVQGDEKRAHSCVTPGSASVKGADGKYVHENVWRYLFTHPVEEYGQATKAESDCTMDLRKKK